MTVLRLPLTIKVLFIPDVDLGFLIASFVKLLPVCRVWTEVVLQILFVDVTTDLQK